MSEFTPEYTKLLDERESLKTQLAEAQKIIEINNGIINQNIPDILKSVKETRKLLYEEERASGGWALRCGIAEGRLFVAERLLQDADDVLDTKWVGRKIHWRKQYAAYKQNSSLVRKNATQEEVG